MGVFVANQAWEVIREFVLFKKKGVMSCRDAWLGASLELQSRQSGDVEPLFGAQNNIGTFATFITVNKKQWIYRWNWALLSIQDELLHSGKCLDERQQLALIS